MNALFISHSSRDKEFPSRLLERLQQRGYQSLFLDFDPDAGLKAGVLWERELYQKLKTAAAVVVLCSPDSMASRWCFAEITQAKALGKSIFPVIIQACEVDGSLTDRQTIDMIKLGEEAGFDRLVEGLRAAGLDASDSFDWDSKRPPFPGFHHFDSEDAAIYFGREVEVRQVIETLTRMHRQDEPRLALIVGSSGSGKSSFARAGLLPRLEKDPEHWVVVEPFRPRNEPFQELAKALAETFPAGPSRPDWSVLRDRLIAASQSPTPLDPQPLSRIVTDLAMAHGRREAAVLITLDQAEEALIRRDGVLVQEQFLRLLREAMTAPGSPIYVLATLRSDDLGNWQNHPALIGLPYLNIPFGPMPGEVLPQVIEGPARIGEIELEDGLASEIAADARSTDALPLLAFTLRAMYDRTSSPRKFTRSLYRDHLKGIEGAVEVVIGEIKQELNLVLGSDAEVAVRRAFLRMVRIDAEGKYARKPAAWDRLPTTALPALERMIEARLLTHKSEEGTENGSTIEVAHESLFRVWDDLARWLTEKREMLLWRQSLQDDLNAWKSKGEAPRSLLGGDRAVEARRMLANDRDEFDPDEVRFLRASIAEEDRKIRQRWVAAVVVAVLAVVATAFGILATLGWRYAVGQGQVAEQANKDLKAESKKLRREAARGRSVLLATQAREILDRRDNFQLGLLLAREADHLLGLPGYNSPPVRLTEATLENALNLIGGHSLVAPQVGLSDDQVPYVTFSLRGHRLFAWTRSGQIRIWKSPRPGDRPFLMFRVPCPIDDFAVDAEGHRMLVLSGSVLSVFEADGPEPGRPVASSGTLPGWPSNPDSIGTPFFFQGRFIVGSFRESTDSTRKGRSLPESSPKPFSGT